MRITMFHRCQGKLWRTQRICECCMEELMDLWKRSVRAEFAEQNIHPSWYRLN
eukprot:SAG22_NODE_18121_length_293_cov_0.551546_1_plen_52_part_10